LIQVTTRKKHGAWFSVALNEKQRIVACSFSDRSRREAERSVRKAISTEPIKLDDSLGSGSGRFREIYGTYTGRAVAVKLDSLDLSHVTPFQRRVYSLLTRIPHGRVTTYGAIAKRLGGLRYSRAVGGAVASNPIPLLVPCHRVVPASLRVGNYGMGGRNPSEGTYMKRRLLEREGVKFTGEKVAESSLWEP
jgi:O-6-methylguanine DNA methyltransferase